jgi:hypothetical protein
VEQFNRRNFLKTAGVASAGTMLAPRLYSLAVMQDEPAKPVAANDHIQIALIGAGGQGQGDTKTAVQVPGVKWWRLPIATTAGWNARRRSGAGHLYHARLQGDSGAQGY